MGEDRQGLGLAVCLRLNANERPGAGRFVRCTRNRPGWAEESGCAGEASQLGTLRVHRELLQPLGQGGVVAAGRVG